MAKKVLTPEQQEIKAMKKEKKSQNWTKFWAIVLALVLTVGIAAVGKSQGEKNVPAEQVGPGNVVNNNNNNNNNNNSNSDNPADSNTDDPTLPASPEDDKPAAEDAAKSEAEVAELINKVTGEAVAQKVGYDWKRDCTVKDVDVGKLTDKLNSLVKSLDKEHKATVDSVVGGFLGNGNKKETVKKGETLDTKVVTKDDGSTENYYHGNCYTLKATNLKAEDIKNLKITGNKYSFDLPDSQNPDRNGNTALSRFTNDIVIREEVESEIKGFTSAVSIPTLQANYSKIKASVTIKDGKLVELTYSYYGEAQLDVKMIITIKGTGNLTTSAVYSNFQY